MFLMNLSQSKQSGAERVFQVCSQVSIVRA